MYQKLVDADEERWFIRALEAVCRHPISRTGRHETAVALGLAFIHIAVESLNVSSRREVISKLEELTRELPSTMNLILVEGLVEYLDRSRDVENAKRQEGLLHLLHACASYTSNTSETVRREMLLKSLLLGHHPSVGGPDRQGWVDLLQRSGLDPREFIAQSREALWKLVCPDISEVSEYNCYTPCCDSQPLKQQQHEQNAWRTARFRAITTLAFLNPDVMLPLFIGKVQNALDPTTINAPSLQDLDIWRTPEGSLCINGRMCGLLISCY